MTSDVAPNYHPLPVVIAHASGVWVTDVQGRRYMDCLAGYSALNFGHCHPELVAVAREQLSRLTLTSRALSTTSSSPSAPSWRHCAAWRPSCR